MAQYVILALTQIAAVALTARRAVTDTGAIPAAGARILGFTRTNVEAGHSFDAQMLGVIDCETGGAIAAGADVQVDAQGRVITLASGVKVGRMAPRQAAATAAGEVVEILRGSCD
jgi:hypothetical protein